jgi:hypothetical protein
MPGRLWDHAFPYALSAAVSRAPSKGTEILVKLME